RPKLLWVWLSAVGLALGGLVVFFLWWFIWSVGPPVRVPNLVGLSVGEARRRARAASFHVEEVWQYNEEVPAGEVLRQYPEPGITVKERSLKLWVSRGPETVPVPDLVGKTPEEARTLLEDQGLVYVEGVKQRSLTVAEGLVAAQNPAPGTRLARGSPVEVDISLGDKFLVEDFRGRPIAEV
ncbi:MAG: PASTA domain-containing protein, partial [Firmicutes bacterium]|nr:PASTA domain-containing protein [Bacillota bacterium]